MYLLFVDTETTGCPADNSKSYKAIDNWPSIRQIAWLVYTKDGEFINGRNYEIGTGDGIHNLGVNYLPKIESPIFKVLPVFLKDLSKCDVIIGHNIEFDVNVILCELYRLGLDTNYLESIQQFCTMKNSVEACGFDTIKGDRYPKLQELYTKLFHRPFDNAHDAYCDIKATADCYWELIENHLNVSEFLYLLDDAEKPDVAIQLFDRAEEIMSGPDRYYWKGWYLDKNGKKRLDSLSRDQAAIELYSKAASLGHLVSMARLGDYYYLHDKGQAASWYIKAIEGGFVDRECFFMCAEACASSKHYEKYRKKFYAKWSSLCESQFDSLSESSICQYIKAFEEGRYGQDINIDKALELYKRALMTQKRPSVRIRYIELLYQLNNKFEYRVELIQQYSFLIEEDKENLRKYQRRIEETIVSYLFDGDGVQRDYVLAKQFIDDIVALSELSRYERNIPAILYYYLGQYFEKGLADCPVDLSKAFQYYLRASGEVPDASRKIGIMYLLGTGCEKNRRNARVFLKAAKIKGLDVSPYYEDSGVWRYYFKYLKTGN